MPKSIYNYHFDKGDYFRLKWVKFLGMGFFSMESSSLQNSSSKLTKKQVHQTWFFKHDFSKIKHHKYKSYSQNFDLFQTDIVPLLGPLSKWELQIPFGIMPL